MLALQEEGVLLRVEAAGHILGQLLKRSAAQIGGVVARRQRVQIRHEIVAVVLLGALRPVLDGPEIGSEGEIAGGLDAREHDFFRSSDRFHSIFLLRNARAGVSAYRFILAKELHLDNRVFVKYYIMMNEGSASADF